MTSKPDDVKRGNVRRFLLVKKNQNKTDRDIAHAVGVSKGLVNAVRREMERDGLIPAREGVVYRPGSSPRGGYVYDETGKTVREAVWLERLKNEPKLRKLVDQAEKKARKPKRKK